jgi:uncharacterized membrane protein
MRLPHSVFGAALVGLLTAPLFAQFGGGSAPTPNLQDTSGSQGMAWAELVFRWAHVVAGVLWIGHLYFFNFVQGGFEGKLDAATKKAVVPELRPRALFWFRWGAAWTWLTGVGLLGLTYYMGLKDSWFETGANKGAAYGMVALCVLVLPMIYDVVSKALGAWDKKTLVVSCALIAVGVGLLGCMGKLTGRALFIHTGAMFGTAMAMNVWMRIWPAQKKIIAAVKNGEKPEDGWLKTAGGRSRANTYMSVPLLLMMVSNSQFGLLGSTMNATYVLLGVVAVGFVACNMLYRKAANVGGM